MTWVWLALLIGFIGGCFVGLIAGAMLEARYAVRLLDESAKRQQS